MQLLNSFVRLGDGTEDISCRIDGNSWLPSETCTGHFTREEAANYYLGLKEHYISYLVFPAVFARNPNFPFEMGFIPPVMELALAGKCLFDTEFKALIQISFLVLIPYF